MFGDKGGYRTRLISGQLGLALTEGLSLGLNLEDTNDVLIRYSLELFGYMKTKLQVVLNL